MSKERLHAQIEQWQKEAEVLDGWLSILNSEKGKHGKFLKSELHKRWSETKEKYRKIDTRNEDKVIVAQQLVMLQTKESVYEELLNQFADLQIRKNVLDKNIADSVEAMRTVEEEFEPLARKPE